MRCSSKLHILRRAKSTCLHACTANFALLGMFTDWQVQCCCMAVLSTGLKLDLYIYIVFLNLAGPVCIRLGARIEVRTPGSQAVRCDPRNLDLVCSLSISIWIESTFDQSLQRSMRRWPFTQARQAINFQNECTVDRAWFIARAQDWISRAPSM